MLFMERRSVVLQGLKCRIPPDIEELIGLDRRASSASAIPVSSFSINENQILSLVISPGRDVSEITYLVFEPFFYATTSSDFNRMGLA
jgi:hypothetical protein